MKGKKKKARRAIRYSTLKLKLTSRQKRSLENFCKSRGTTPVKIIKKSIRPLLENYASAIPSRPKEAVNQLTLFETPSEDLQKDKREKEEMVVIG